MRVDVDVSRDLDQPVSREHVRADPAGTADGFDDFYRRELPGLVALARALAGTAADDVAQEAMLAAFRRWDHVRRLDDPGQWVRRTCSNLAVSAFRRRMVELRGVTRLASRHRPAPAVAETSEEFWRAIRALPRRQAQCSALRYVYSMEGADIAATLGITEGSVKVHLARARRTLARTLQLDEEEGS